ncbi:MAG: 23S rRNA (guanosine(2251)-2'-O)-methyltransferase RlmB, partial [Firmicutes bacterium]|nr:23S rRNA (guanosine(2251)-2'-O)-methyltransferase RlmB [Bacillota bacterium]
NLPEEDISLPEENISLPEEDISLPEEIINPPEEDISLPEENRNLPEENINLPKETLNFPEEDLSLPEDEIKTVPQNLYDEKMGAEKLKAAIHENKTSDTLSAWQTQKLLSLSKENKLPHQNPGVAMAPNKLISGKNAVLEALRSGQTINRVLLAEEQSGTVVNEVIRRCRENGVPYQFLPKARLTKIAGPDHRGVVCELSSLSYAELEDVLQAAQESGEQPLILLLDGIEDPYNLGAIIRTALCAGAHGIVIPKRRAVSFTNAVAKSSAGASAYLPLVRVSNLSQTARILQQAGLWLAAADMSGNSAWQSDLRGPLALVLGGEGTGVSPLLKRQCDLCVSLPMSGPLGSLNVSAAAAALLYEIRRQRTTE